MKLTEKTSTPSTAKEIGLKESQLYTWHTSANRKKTVSERESALATENARLIRQLSEQAEELEILGSVDIIIATTALEPPKPAFPCN